MQQPLIAHHDAASIIEQDEEVEPPSPVPLSANRREALLLTPASSVIPLRRSYRRKTLKTLNKTQIFRKQFYPHILNKDWNSWQWQVRNRICSQAQITRFLSLTSDEESAFSYLKTKLPLGITPYYMSLMQREGSDYPLRKTVVPTVHEFFKLPGEQNDPLGEEHQSPVPGLVHRYPDRVLLLISDFCAAYCRYCTRSRMVGRGIIHPGENRLERAFEYIRQTPAIRDVLLSGGDPLTLSDKKLDWILSKIREIEHVEIIRIGTKTPAVLPQRITPQLVKILKKYHPLLMSIHFTHPDECTPESAAACAMLADAGIPLGSQTVLLKGVNDQVDTMKSLVHNLLKMRVRPYYLYQCDPVTGTSHFRTPVETGVEIIRGLRGHTSGYAIPTYVIDAPGGGGKIPVMPDYVVDRTETEVILTNFENRIFHYPTTTVETGEVCPGGN